MAGASCGTRARADAHAASAAPASPAASPAARPCVCAPPARGRAAAPQERGLNDSFSGGVSSYALVTLLVAFLRAAPPAVHADLGLGLVAFCEHFVGQYDARALGCVPDPLSPSARARASAPPRRRAVRRCRWRCDAVRARGGASQRARTPRRARARHIPPSPPPPRAQAAGRPRTCCTRATG